jgi:hypothetical protein
MKKIMLIISAIFFFFMASREIDAMSDTITINTPVDIYSGTNNGNSLIFTGTSSQPNTEILIFLNDTQIASTTTDRYGNWITSYFLCNGTYTIAAALVSPYLLTLAQNNVTFAVDNGTYINLNPLTFGNIVFINPLVVNGGSSFAHATVNILLNGNLVTTTTTDARGNWQASYSIITNGSYTLSAELLDNGYSVASASLDITAAIPIIFPANKSQVSVIAGVIPTSGSGSGPGYTYIISGSIATINFTPAFDSIPSVIATGLRSAGSSTVTVTSISKTAANVAFSTGTQNINFTAAIFS